MNTKPPQKDAVEHLGQQGATQLSDNVTPGTMQSKHIEQKWNTYKDAEQEE